MVNKESSKPTKTLNLYAGIGGNRKLWENVEVTAIENNPKIAKIYQDFFPNDEVIVTDAHQYLLEHYKEFDFIWSSPPCPSHSRINTFNPIMKGKKYLDMKLYEEIILLKHFFKGKWVVENVISYYKPLIKPYECNSHYYWSNFYIFPKENETRNIIKIDGRECETTEEGIKFMEKEFKINLSNYNLTQNFKEKILNNCVQPKIGLEIFRMAFKDKQEVLL